MEEEKKNEIQELHGDFLDVLGMGISTDYKRIIDVVAAIKNINKIEKTSLSKENITEKTKDRRIRQVLESYDVIEEFEDSETEKQNEDVESEEISEAEVEQTEAIDASEVAQPTSEVKEENTQTPEMEISKDEQEAQKRSLRQAAYEETKQRYTMNREKTLGYLSKNIDVLLERVRAAKKENAKGQKRGQEFETENIYYDDVIDILRKHHRYVRNQIKEIEKAHQSEMVTDDIVPENTIEEENIGDSTFELAPEVDDGTETIQINPSEPEKFTEQEFNDILTRVRAGENLESIAKDYAKSQEESQEPEKSYFDKAPEEEIDSSHFELAPEEEQEDKSHFELADEEGEGIKIETKTPAEEYEEKSHFEIVQEEQEDKSHFELADEEGESIKIENKAPAEEYEEKSYFELAPEENKEEKPVARVVAHKVRGKRTAGEHIWVKNAEEQNLAEDFEWTYSEGESQENEETINVNPQTEIEAEPAQNIESLQETEPVQTEETVVASNEPEKTVEETVVEPVTQAANKPKSAQRVEYVYVKSPKEIKEVATPKPAEKEEPTTDTAEREPQESITDEKDTEPAQNDQENNLSQLENWASVIIAGASSGRKIEDVLKGDKATNSIIEKIQKGEMNINDAKKALNKKLAENGKTDEKLIATVEKYLIQRTNSAKANDKETAIEKTSWFTKFKNFFKSIPGKIKEKISGKAKAEKVSTDTAKDKETGSSKDNGYFPGATLGVKVGNHFIGDKEAVNDANVRKTEFSVQRPGNNEKTTYIQGNIGTSLPKDLKKVDETVKDGKRNVTYIQNGLENTPKENMVKYTVKGPNGEITNLYTRGSRTTNVIDNKTKEGKTEASSRDDGR